MRKILSVIFILSLVSESVFAKLEVTPSTNTSTASGKQSFAGFGKICFNWWKDTYGTTWGMSPADYVVSINGGFKNAPSRLLSFCKSNIGSSADPEHLEKLRQAALEDWRSMPDSDKSGKAGGAIKNVLDAINQQAPRQTQASLSQVTQ